MSAPYDDLGGAAYDRWTEESEYCWGSGLEPANVEGAPPAEGGRYRGKTPPVDPQIGLGRSL